MLVVEHPPDPPHRRDELRALVLVERLNEAVDRIRLQRVHLREGRPSRGGEADQLPTRVGCRRFPLDESVGDEPRQDPAQIARVQIEGAPQFRHSHLVGVREFEQDTSFGQPECRADQLRPQEPEDAGIEAVETADFDHRRRRHG